MTTRVIFGGSMIPVDQTLFGDGKGNCFAACLASVLEVSLDSVPNFCVDNPSNYLEATNGWLAQFGLGMMIVDVRPQREGNIDCPDAYHLMSGPSPRGKFHHSVVGKGGKMVHDPHHSRAGLARLHHFDLFIALDACCPLCTAVLRNETREDAAQDRPMPDCGVRAS